MVNPKHRARHKPLVNGLTATGYDPRFSLALMFVQRAAYLASVLLCVITNAKIDARIGNERPTRARDEEWI